VKEFGPFTLDILTGMIVDGSLFVQAKKKRPVTKAVVWTKPLSNCSQRFEESISNKKQGTQKQNEKTKEIAKIKFTIALFHE